MSAEMTALDPAAFAADFDARLDRLRRLIRADTRGIHALARASGRSNAHIHKILNNERKPAFETVLSIVLAQGLDLSDLEPGKKFPEKIPVSN